MEQLNTKIKITAVPQAHVSVTDNIRYYNKCHQPFNLYKKTKQLVNLQRYNGCTFKMVNGENHMGLKNNLEQKRTCRIQTVNTKETIYSSYLTINQPLEFCCTFCYKEIWKMQKSYRSKSCQQGNSTNGLSTIWDSFCSLLPKGWSLIVIDFLH